MKILILVILCLNSLFSFDKIVSIGIDATDVLMNLEQAHKIVASDSVSVGYYTPLDCEKVSFGDILKIKELAPEAVILGSGNDSPNFKSELELAGFKVFEFRANKSKESFEEQLRACGEFLGVYNLVVDLEADYNAKFAQIEFINIMNEVEAKVVYLKLLDGRILKAPKKSVVGDIINISGAKNNSVATGEWVEIQSTDLDSSDYILIEESSYRSIVDTKKLDGFEGKTIVASHSLSNYCLNTPDEILSFLNQIISISY